MASTKPGPLGKNILTFGLRPGPLSWVTLETPGNLGRRDLVAPDFSFVQQPLTFDIAAMAASLTVGIPILRLGAPRGAATTSTVGMIPESGLTPAATVEETEFKHKVYRAHVARASKVRPFFPGVAPTDLATVEPGISMRKDAAEAAKKLLADLRSTLASQQAAKDPQALKVSSITVVSGYRDPKKDFGLWDSYYQGYYAQTAKLRQAAAGGEFGPAAVEILVNFIAGKKAAPGYSNHTRGTAFDIVTVEGGKAYGVDSHPKAQAGYAKTWLRAWMVATAGKYDFKPLATEVWHWDYTK